MSNLILCRLINEYADARISWVKRGKFDDPYDLEMKLARARMALELEILRITGEEIEIE